jgi:hypothetical protein
MLAPVLDRNICALLARRQAEERRKGWQDFPPEQVLDHLSASHPAHRFPFGSPT